MPASYELVITRWAEKDLAAIYDYIAKDNPANAKEFIQALEERMVTLERFPERCALIPENELLGTQYRHLIFGQFRVLIKIQRKKVVIMRMIHSARLLDDSLFGNK